MSNRQEQEIQSLREECCALRNTISGLFNALEAQIRAYGVRIEKDFDNEYIKLNDTEGE